MQAIFNKAGNCIGYIEKCEHGGWFAYTGDFDGEATQGIYQTKQQAIAAVKREARG